MLFVDHESRNVVLVIRGTFTINDLVIDALCDEVPFLDGYAHRGMVNVSFAKNDYDNCIFLMT